MAPCGRRQGRTTLVDLPLTSFLRGHMFTLCGAARRLGARCMDFGDERAAPARRTVKRAVGASASWGPRGWRGGAPPPTLRLTLTSPAQYTAQGRVSGWALRSRVEICMYD